MEHARYLHCLLKPYEPQLSVDRLVEEVNRLYHSFEASSYDDRHPLLRQQLPGIWAAMVDGALANGAEKPWDVLDFGCGTGFASEQVLSLLPIGRLRSLTCYDPSPEMLEQCQSRLKPLCPSVRTVSQFAELAESRPEFNVIITNSVLHHLSDPLQTIRDVSQCLADDAIWLCGHEPSARFYRNPACVELYRRYQQSQQWRRYFQPTSYFRRIARTLGLTVDPAARAAVAAHRLGLFRQRPPRLLVSQLVDFHVAISADEVECGKGFDVRTLQAGLRDCWTLEWHHTYNLLGPTWDGNASAAWRARFEELTRQYPDDGAFFCSVWRRSECPQPSMA